MSQIRSGWHRVVLLTLIAVAILATAVLGLRSYRSFLLLQSAHEVGEPEVGDLRPWMTLRYVASTYGAPEALLIERLELPTQTDPETSLRSIAEGQGLPPFQYVQRVQRAVAYVERKPSLNEEQEGGWLEALGDRLLTAVLIYGYPVLGLILMLGAIGLPVPTGLSTAVAGSLAARGSMSWGWASAVVVLASVIGDLVGYGVGRVLSTPVLERHGRWIGYTVARQERVQRMFRRWGGATVFLSRTLASHLSSVVNLLAGASRYRQTRFLVLTLLGRFAWTSAYLGLGWAVGSNLTAASDFLKHLGGFLVSFTVLLALGVLLYSGNAPADRYRETSEPFSET